MAIIRQKLSAKVAVLTIATSILAGGAVGLVDYHTTQTRGVAITKRDALLVAATLASRINGNSVKAIQNEMERVDPTYREVQQKLLQARDEFKLESVPFIVRVVGDSVEYAAVEDGTNKIGGRVEVSPEMRTALDLDTNGASDVYADARGSWIAGYSPLHDDGGNQAGIVVVELPPSAIAGGLAMFLFRSGATGGMIGLLMTIVSFLMMTRVVSVVEQTRNAVSNMVENRANSVAIEVTGTDEVAQLARSVNLLAETWRSGLDVKPKSHAPTLEIHRLQAQVQHLNAQLALSRKRLEERDSRVTVAPAQVSAPLVAKPEPPRPPVLGHSEPPRESTVEEPERPRSPVVVRPEHSPESTESTAGESELSAVPEQHLETAGGIMVGEPVEEEVIVHKPPDVEEQPKAAQRLEPVQAQNDPILDLSAEPGNDDVYLVEETPSEPPMPSVYVEGVDSGCDLRTGLEDALLDMDSDAAMRGLIFQVDIDEHVPPIPFEAELLKSALGEMLAQAALVGKPNSEGSINCTRAGKQCEVSVRVVRASEGEGPCGLDLTRLTAFSEHLEGMCWTEEEAGAHITLRLEFPLVADKTRFRPGNPVPQVLDERKSLADQGLLV